MTNKKQGGEGGGGSGGVSSSTTQLVSSPRKKCGKCVGGAGGGGVVDRSNFKKGPWTAEEDALLMEYVKNHGERHWNCVQKTGLMRCGKSCRLRWTNHLRPDLKKGAFKPEEERIVLDLHAKLGNKWSKIAAELPGRTDNEVKNFWNTKIKRRMKAKLPVQPEAKQQQQQHQIKATSAPFHFDYQQHKNHQYFPHHHQIRRDPTSTHSLPSSPSLYTSLFSPTSIPKSSLIETPPPGVLSTYGVQQQQDLTMPALNLMSSTTQNDPILSFLNNPAYNKFKFFGEDELKMRFSSATPVSRFAMPISSAPPPIYSSSIRSPSLISSMPSPIQFHAGNGGGVNLTLQTDNSGVQIDQQSGIANELPSFQIANMTENSPSSAGNYLQQQQQGTSGSSTGAGLSNDILQESWSCVLQQTSDAEKSAGMMDQTTCSFPMGNDPASYDNHLGVSSSGDQSHAHHTSTGMMQKKGSIADMAAPMDDDLPSLLDTFSSIGSPPEWYLTNTAAAAGRPMSISSTGNTVLDLDHNEAAAHTSLPNAAASSTTEFDWSLGTSYWNNMHGIS